MNTIHINIAKCAHHLILNMIRSPLFILVQKNRLFVVVVYIQRHFGKTTESLHLFGVYT